MRNSTNCGLRIPATAGRTDCGLEIRNGFALRPTSSPDLLLICFPVLPPSSCSPVYLFTCSARRAFTLVELMVVIAIIGILLVLAVPAIGPMLASNHMAEAANTINGLLTTAQVQAEANVTPVGIRIERAFTTVTAPLPPPNGSLYELMYKDLAKPQPKDQPEWLDHQQARFVIFASKRYQYGAGFKNQIFEQIPDSKVVTLPKSAWLAPDYCVNWAAANLAENNLFHAPNDTNATPYNRLETFYVAFNKMGELTRFAAGDNIYKDHTQAYDNTPSAPPPVLDAIVDHPDESARGLLIYNRQNYEQLDPTNGQSRLNYLQREARAVFLNRTAGSVVQEKQQ